MVLANGGEPSGLFTRRRRSLLRRKAQREERGCGFGGWGEVFGVVHMLARSAFAEKGAEGGCGCGGWGEGFGVAHTPARSALAEEGAKGSTLSAIIHKIES